MSLLICKAIGGGLLGITIVFFGINANSFLPGPYSEKVSSLIPAKSEGRWKTKAEEYIKAEDSKLIKWLRLKDKSDSEREDRLWKACKDLIGDADFFYRIGNKSQESKIKTWLTDWCLDVSFPELDKS